ncbi:MAG: hotdog fold thioesterase [Bacteroidetes bacterium]|nr:hotdog fold thioesterase [Bacteroidota bacterium]MBS1932889.1 hotdog fold thioesterase [Bacteroidota bacterium]
MSIWFNKSITVAELQALSKGTMGEHIGIEFTEIGENFLKAKMPVDHRTKQPYGLLHGGASASLAETMGSVASALVIDNTVSICVGLEINANHIRGVKEGFVYGTAIPLHIGSSTHVWEIKIYSEQEKLVCVSRLTVSILKKKA